MTCAMWALALACSLVGCGGSDAPTISDSNKYLIEAREAISSDDTAKALEALSASIAAQPSAWAYLERAKINAQQGTDQAVLDDCQEILKLHPENKDVPWLQGELKKPTAGRFKGQFEIPPSYRK